jgi:hypothetical protein
VNHYYPGADDEEELSGRHEFVDIKLSRQCCWESPAKAWCRALRLVSLSLLHFEEQDRASGRCRKKSSACLHRAAVYEASNHYGAPMLTNRS